MLSFFRKPGSTMCPALWMLFSSFCFTVMAVFVKTGSAEVGTMGLVFFRGLFAVAAIGLWAAVCRRPVGTPHLKAHLKRSLCGVVSMALWLYSLARLPLGTGMTLSYTSPLFMAAAFLAAALWRGQRPQWGLAAAAVLGFFGVTLVLEPDFSAGERIAVGAGLLSALVGTLVGFQIRDLARVHEPSWRVVFYFSLVCVAFGAAGHLAGGTPVRLTAHGALCCVGVGASALIAQLALTKAFSSGNILVTAVMEYSAIVFALLFDAVLGGQTAGPRALAGIAAIVAAGVLSTFLTRRGGRPRKEKGHPVRFPGGEEKR